MLATISDCALGTLLAVKSLLVTGPMTPVSKDNCSFFTEGYGVTHSKNTEWRSHVADTSSNNDFINDDRLDDST